MAADAWTSARLGDMNDSPLGGLYLAEAVKELGKWTAPAFASAAARDAAFAAWVADGNTASTGMQCYVVGIGRMVYRSGAWRPVDLQVYTSLAARDAGFPSPIAGDHCICLKTHMAHDGIAWRFTLSGKATSTTDSNGFFTIPHGGGQAPTGWVIVPSYQGSGASDAGVTIVTSNNAGDPTVLGARAVYNQTTYYSGGSVITTNWMAQF